MLGHRTAVEEARQQVAGAREHAHRAARRASPWLERLARLGFAAKGVVYVLVGVLAAQAAAGVGGDTTDTHGALEHVLEAPFGRIGLAVIALGLAGYALWAFVQAALDVDDDGTDSLGLLRRAGHAVVGVTYAGLVVWAVGLLVGANGDRPEPSDPTHDRTVWLMSQPVGAWLVGLVGAAVIGVGLCELWKAWRGDPCADNDVRVDELRPRHQKWVDRVARVGYAAHGVTLGLIGGFLVGAAVQAQPDEARGLGGALSTLATQPEGPWLLGLVAAGLVAYGLFMLVQARYRQVAVR
ncbi:MAG TPA: DUF1206 domain-containing protein [Chloroflexota bacterium]|jgi:hypothetical protein